MKDITSLEEALLKLAEEMMNTNNEPELKIISSKIAYLIQIYSVLT